MVNVTEDNLTGFLVQPALAKAQYDAEIASLMPSGSTAASQSCAASSPTQNNGNTIPGTGGTPSQRNPTRFHGTVTLDSARVGRDAGRIADEVISHLAGIVGATVKVTLEIEADVPQGVTENVVRTVTENSRTLKFSNQGFESE